MGIQILAGHIEITYYTLLIMALYALWRLTSSVYRIDNSIRDLPNRATAAGWLLAMVLLGLLLGSVQLIPFVEVGQANFRQDSASFAEVQEWAFKPRRILTLALPNFFGNPAHHDYVDVLSGETMPFQTAYDGSTKTNSEWGLKNYVEGGIYLGILPLFLAVLGVAGGRWRVASKKHDPQLATRNSQTWFFTLLSLLSLAFIFGTPLYALVFYGLPFANQLHTPFRWVFPLSLCVAALAGFGFDDLRLKIKDSSRNLQSSILNLLIIVSFAGGICWFVGLFVSRLVYGRIEPIINRLFLGLAGAASAFPNARAFYSYEFRQLLILGVMLVGTGIVLWLSQFNRKGREERKEKNSAPFASLRLEFLAVALIILDLYLANVGFNAAVDPALLDYKPELVEWLQEQPGYWRITSFAPHGDKPFNANSGWLFDIQDVRGYDSIIPKQYTDYMAAIEPQNELQFNRVQPIVNWESLNSPLLDVLGVKYIITAETIDLPKLKLAWEGESLRVYENLAVAPRAYTLPLTSTAVTDDPLAAMTKYDPRQFVVAETGDWRLETNLQPPVSGLQSPVSIDEYKNIQVVASAKVAEPSWLILNDSYFPGWKAWVRPYNGTEADEQEVEITRVNGNFRGVLLEPGHWTVRFRYSPASFQLGALASAMGGVILLFALGIWGWRRVVKTDAEMTTTRSLAKNSLVPVILNIVNKFVDFAFAAFYLRFLGPVEAGSFGYAIATAGFFDIISNFGLNILLTRDVSQERSRASSYLLNTSVLRLGTGFVGALPILVWVWFTAQGSNPPTGAEVTAISFIAIGMVFSGMAQGVTGLFYVHERRKCRRR
ncbi:MAG: oligosaccharide flippase family protein [Ardenticatenaceae bacterium]|nr:oligosaccharide flippase family protein [Ardenticatenaceae bacterium]